MELMEGLTIVATESNGDVGIGVGIIIMGLVMIAFGGLILFLSHGYEEVGVVIGTLWTIFGLFLILLGVFYLLFNEPTEVYTVVADNSVNLNQILEQYEILECDGNTLKIQLRD